MRATLSVAATRLKTKKKMGGAGARLVADKSALHLDEPSCGGKRGVAADTRGARRDGKRLVRRSYGAGRTLSSGRSPAWQKTDRRQIGKTPVRACESSPELMPERPAAAIY
jgi:hypothetical protein